MFSRTGVLLAVVLTAAWLSAQPASPAAPANEPIADNYYAASNRVDVTAPVYGDVVAAGRDVMITSLVTGDVLAAARRLHITGETSDDVRVAGWEVMVNAPVDGDLTAAGNDVQIGPRTHVTGRAWLTGSTVRVGGVFDREVEIAAGTVELGGEIRKPVTVIAERLEVRPDARILSTLTYRSPAEAVIPAGATVVGPVAYTRIESKEAKEARSLVGVSSVLFIIHLLLAGTLVVLFVPRAATAVVDTMRAIPGRSVLLGFALLVATPIAALLLVISVIGIPVGVTMGAVYLLMLPLAVVSAAFYIGDAEMRWLGKDVTTRRERAAMLAAGVITLALLRLVPVVGTLVVFLGVLLGLGAMSLASYRSLQHAGV